MEISATTIRSDHDASRERMRLVLLLLLCLGARVATAIYYIEDIDSLRFALGVVDYDLAAMRPHFPGYPVFCALAWLLYEALGSYALAFAAVGGLSTFVIIWSLLAILRARLDSPEGIAIAALAFFNPMLWLMANRYMPDLAGVACLLAACALLIDQRDTMRRPGFLLVGVLPGVRLSYLPFLLVPVIVAWVRGGKRARDLLYLVAGALLWFIPFLAVTGWESLIAAARLQTDGHFNEFGGTIRTEPMMSRRITSLITGIWADGLGGYWPGRSVVTAVVGVGLLIALVVGVRALRERAEPVRRAWPLLAGCVVYLLWIFFFQNVIHNSRHVMPLIPFILLPVAIGLVEMIGRRRVIGWSVAAIFLIAYCFVGAYIAVQHREPTAIAQTHEHVASLGAERLTVVSVPLVRFYLESQGIEARYLSVDDPGVRDSLAAGGPGRLISVGDYRALIGREPREVRRFYHNPYVNRVWPQLEVHDYGDQ